MNMPTHSPIPFGLFELDQAGTVIHYSAPTEKDGGDAHEGIVGRDFFREVAPAAELKELKSRFLRFMTFGDAVERFSISFPLNREVIKVQIVLARITEHSDGEDKRLALVRIMPDGQSSS